MSRSKCSRELYCSFLEVTSSRYSALSLSEVAPSAASLSHDSVSRWLAVEKVQPKDLWKAAKKEVHGTSGILVFDDVVIDKSRSGKMELVNWQYAGSKHDITKGIGVVNALWQLSKEQYIPMDYRIWNPPEDGKTKNDHFQDMLSSTKTRGGCIRRWSLPTAGTVASRISSRSALMAGTGSWGSEVTGWLANRTSSSENSRSQMKD